MDNKKGVPHMLETIQKWGNSLGVRIPKKVAEELGIVNGLKLDFSVVDGNIVLKSIEKAYNLEELMAQILLKINMMK